MSSTYILGFTVVILVIIILYVVTKKPAPTIKNIVQASNSGVATTTTNGVATLLSASITPSSKTSQILVTLSGVLGGIAGAYVTILRNGANLAGGGDLAYVSGGTSSVSCSYLDSPASTAKLTYVVWFGTNSGQTVSWNPQGNVTTLILQEI